MATVSVTLLSDEGLDTGLILRGFGGENRRGVRVFDTVGHPVGVRIDAIVQEWAGIDPITDAIPIRISIVGISAMALGSIGDAITVGIRISRSENESNFWRWIPLDPFTIHIAELLAIGQAVAIAVQLA